MALLFDTQAWVAFLTLAVLEIVLGIDNIIFLVLVVDRLPLAQRRSARFLGLLFAMLTRIGLLFSITWLATLRNPWLTLHGWQITVRDAILFVAGAFLIVKGVLEIRSTLTPKPGAHREGLRHGFWVIVLEVGLIDIVFSLDSVFSAVGLANDIEVMVAAIVASVLVMLTVASKVSAFIARYPTIKILGLAFLVLVGGVLIAEAFDRDVPKAYLYFALAFAGVVEGLNIRLKGKQT